MTTLRKYSGKLLSIGGSERDPGLIRYDYWRIETDAGDAFLQGVIVPAALDSVTSAGAVTIFYIAEVPFPKFFLGSKPMYLVYGVKSGDRIHEAIEPVQRFMRVLKLGTIKLFAAGVPAMFLWGIGLLLWVMAFRLLAISLPLRKMRKELLS